LYGCPHIQLDVGKERLIAVSDTGADSMKYAVVKPLFKKGDKSKISNYRPISILSSFSKVLEKVMYNQFQEHLNKYSISQKNSLGLDLILQRIKPYTS
jgi:hypothetical protein